MMPQVLIVLAVFLVGSVTGWRVNSNHRDALELEGIRARQEALQAAAEEIAKIDVKQVTINRQIERLVTEKTLYKECRNTPEAVDVINTALKGGEK